MIQMGFEHNYVLIIYIHRIINILNLINNNIINTYI